MVILKCDQIDTESEREKVSDSVDSEETNMPNARLIEWYRITNIVK
jgi:hypothetical protein